MDGLEKVALLLKGLGSEASAAILAQLSSGQAERVRARMRELAVGPEQQQALRQVLREVAQACPEELGPKTEGGPRSAGPKEQPATAKTDLAGRTGPGRLNVVIDENS